MDRFSHDQLSEATANAKGAKSCKLDSNGAQVIFNLGDSSLPAYSPFGATNYGDDTSYRQSIEFKLTPEQQKHWEAFDQWCLDYLHTNSQRIFKKQMTHEQLRESYRSPVTRKEGFENHLRCKINSSGPKVARAWKDQERIELPSNLKNVPLVPRITLSHMWMMTPEETCPF